MPQHDLLELFIGPLNRLELPYAVTGATAAIVYGEPRLTNAVDLVVYFQHFHNVTKSPITALNAPNDIKALNVIVGPDRPAP